MNKGLEKRNKKLQKNTQKRNIVKPEQANLCRFVELKWQNIERVNGKYRDMGHASGKGLQIRNRVYLLDGHYKLVNSKSVQITKIYDDVPKWATDELIKQYREGQKP